jgi:hypothetical protein
MPNPPIACTLTPGQINGCRDHLIPGLFTRALGHEGVDNGYRLTFAPATDTLRAIAETIDRERQCCQFLRFQLTIEPAGGAIVLDLTGPEGTREFLDDLVRNPTQAHR